MANDSLFLVCRGCSAAQKIYKHYGYADPTAYITGDELGTFIAEHLYCTGTGDGFHLPEDAFETVSEHVLMRRVTNV